MPLEEGIYGGEWTAEKPGSYVAEIIAGHEQEEIGHECSGFRREDGVAENFHTSQNRELLEKLAQQTGGRYYTPAEASKLSKEISYSEAGITARETRDLWDMPVIFLLALGIRGVGVAAAAEMGRGMTGARGRRPGAGARLAGRSYCSPPPAPGLRPLAPVIRRPTFSAAATPTPESRAPVKRSPAYPTNLSSRGP